MANELRYQRGNLKASDDGTTVEGYAAKYNVLSEDLGGFREVILPGAFDLENSPDITCRYEHLGPLLGRRSSGTAEILADDIGLWFRCRLPATTDAQNMVELIRRGDLDGCSFKFYCAADGSDEEWIMTNEGTVRQIRHCTIGDVSIVEDPAYPNTELAIRSMQRWKETSEPVVLPRAKLHLSLIEKWI